MKKRKTLSSAKSFTWEKHSKKKKTITNFKKNSNKKINKFQEKKKFTVYVSCLCL